MATLALIPDDQTVYRGMRNPSWVKRGVVRHLAFMLRDATDQFPIEQELSLGLTPESAVDELKQHYGIASLSVRAIHNLPHGLTVRPEPGSTTKAEMFGLPLYSTDPTQRDLAVTMATDLAGLAQLLSVAGSAPTPPTGGSAPSLP
jgi:hypothetical protein